MSYYDLGHGRLAVQRRRDPTRLGPTATAALHAQRVQWGHQWGRLVSDAAKAIKENR